MSGKSIYMEVDHDHHVYEWTIVNFSCWNSQVHGEVIRSPSFRVICDLGSFLLYPRDFDGRGENIVVQFLYDEPPKSCYCLKDLSLIGSNGSLICSQQIDREMPRDGFTARFPLLKFGDLVAQIRKNEADDQDQLSVKLKIKFNMFGYYYVKRIRTTIKVHDVSVKIPWGIIDELSEGKLQVIRFPLNEEDYDYDERVQIHLFKRKNCYSSVIKYLIYSVRKLIVSTRTSVLNKDDVILKTVDCEHVFNNEEEKTTLIPLTKEEVKEKHCSLFISVKIILPDSEFKNYFSIGRGIYLMPPNSLHSKFVTAYCPDSAVAVLLKELMCLLQDQDFSDFQLNCGGVSLPVHKNILSARSPVFKRLLSSDMREAASGAVDIEDLDAPTLARFIAFLYTGTVGELQGESALRLYYAADKYQVPSLKRECVNVLCASVSISNVGDVLSLADKHRDDQLKSLAHDFILRNYNEVLGSSEWESFMNREPMLVAKTLTQLGQKKSVVKASTS